MKRLLDFLALTERERRGFIVLLSLICFISLMPFGYKAYLKRNQSDIPIHWSSLDEIVEGASPSYSFDESFLEKETRPEKASKEHLFPFNPNDLPIEKWRSLGFSDKQIQVIKNYETKGGRFYKKEDVAKIYAISEKEFRRIEPYLRFDAQKEHNIPVVRDNKKRETPYVVDPVDINKADTVAFKRLKGIGSVYAARIVKFREALGGFHHVGQIKEVYGISDELFQAIHESLILEEKNIRQLEVNRLEVEELAKHPYISKKEASLIVNYRMQHGVFQSIEDLKNIYALSDDFLRKIAPYLRFN